MMKDENNEAKALIEGPVEPVSYVHRQLEINDGIAVLLDAEKPARRIDNVLRKMGLYVPWTRRQKKNYLKATKR